MFWVNLYDEEGIRIPTNSDSPLLYRKFCEKHLIRGEGYYEDEDDNYENITSKVEL